VTGTLPYLLNTYLLGTNCWSRENYIPQQTGHTIDLGTAGHQVIFRNIINKREETSKEWTPCPREKSDKHAKAHKKKLTKVLYKKSGMAPKSRLPS
jgi:hypothetical protein